MHKKCWGGSCFIGWNEMVFAELMHSGCTADVTAPLCCIWPACFYKNLYFIRWLIPLNLLSINCLKTFICNPQKLWIAYFIYLFIWAYIWLYYLLYNYNKNSIIKNIFYILCVCVCVCLCTGHTYSMYFIALDFHFSIWSQWVHSVLSTFLISFSNIQSVARDVTVAWQLAVMQSQTLVTTYKWPSMKITRSRHVLWYGYTHTYKFPGVYNKPPTSMQRKKTIF